MAQWLSDVKGEHFHASTMLCTLAMDASVYDTSEKKALLLQTRELLAKAKEAPGWAYTKARLNFEYEMNQKLIIVLEWGLPEWEACMERNVEIAMHELCKGDPEKKVQIRRQTHVFSHPV